MAVHQRNGGTLRQLDPAWALLEPALGIDSLDLAEIVVKIERQYCLSLFDRTTPPKTWGEVGLVVDSVAGACSARPAH